MELWQWHCRNRMEKKNCNWLVAMPLPKQGGKKKKLAIEAIPLPKMGRKKKSGFRNL